MNTTHADSKRAYDVIIIGGGPAGLSAALLLGRSRRRVLLCDAGRPRNASSHELHGFLSRDGIAPRELRLIGRKELEKYETIELRDVEVADAAPDDSGFVVAIAGDTTLRCRKLLLATGVVDQLPQVSGFESIYGRSAFHCPYCDGWEFRDQNLAVYGPGTRGLGLATELKCWSAQITLCTDGPSHTSDDERSRLKHLGIPLCEERVIAFESRDGRLYRVTFDGRAPIACKALFFDVGELQASELVRKLGCKLTEKGAVVTNDDRSTSIPGLFVAGDACKGAQLAIIAAAEGAQAAIAINTHLIKEDTTGAYRSGHAT